MKVKVHIKYPYVGIFEDDREVEVPDNVLSDEIDDWLWEHRHEILENNGCESTGRDLDNALDFGYADVTLIKEKNND